MNPIIDRNASLDVFTLRGSLASLFFVTTRTCLGPNDPTCCLERDEKQGNKWKFDTDNEIAELIDENLDDSLFYELFTGRKHKGKTYCYVYCAPCMASIWLAAHICRNECWKGRNTNMIWRIRPDERLDPENCDARTRIKDIISAFEFCRRHPGDYGWWQYLDQNHIRRRMHASSKNVRGTDHKDLNETNRGVGGILKEQRSAPNCAALVFIASTATHHAFSSLPGFHSFSEVPKANQIYEYRWDQNPSTMMREPIFLGTYQSVS